MTMILSKNKSAMYHLSLLLTLTNAFTPSMRHQISFLTIHRTSYSNHDRQNMIGMIELFNNNKNSRGRETLTLRMSSVGDGNGNNDNFGGGGGSSNSGGLDDWLDPRKASEESDNLKRAREQISEESLPINFDMSSDIDDDDDASAHDDIENKQENESLEGTENNESKDDDETAETTTSENDLQSTMQNLIEEKEELTGKLDLLRGNGKNATATTTTAELMSSNPYLQVVSKLSPSDLISKFTSTAHPRVQDAVRSTVLGLIGTLPKMAFETTTITTGERLASLMFQLQLTGYMLKNADYRLSLSQSLGMTTSVSKNGQNQYLLEGDLDYDEDYEEGGLSEGKVRGKIKITYGKKNDEDEKDQKDATSDESKGDETETNDEEDDDNDATVPSMEVEVDAAAYMAELRNEVAKLREDLVTTRKEKEDEIRKDLLLYIRTLPQKELKSLTSTLSDDVLNAMKGLVNVVMAGIGEGQIGPDTVTEQSGEAMAQLCMWQLVVGYNLRELEVREEMKNALRSGSLDFSSESNSDDGSADGGEGSIDFDQGGFE